MADKYWLGNDSGNEGDYSVAANWSPTNVPVANDSVYITGSQSITAGLSQGGVELDDFIVLPDYTGDIGSASGSLVIDMADADRFEFAGRGTSYIDVGTAAITARVKQTKTAANGQSGLYLDGSAIATLIVEAGSVELHDDCTATTVDVRSGATLRVGTDATGTTIHNNGGTVHFEGTTTTINTNGGTTNIKGSDAVTTVKCTGGTVNCTTTGTVTNAQALSTGVIDLTGSSVSRTVTNMKVEGTGKIDYDPNVVTLTNAPAGDGKVSLRAS